MRRALAIDDASFGDHPIVAISLNNLARLLLEIHRFGEAEPLMRRALAIDEASLGDNHPSVAISLNNLGSLLQASDRICEAELLMRRALAIHEASFGDDHPEVAISLSNLARLLHATGRFAEAEPLTRRLLVVFLKFERATGHAHQYRDVSIRNYQTLLSSMGRDRGGIRLALRDAFREAGLPAIGT